MIDGEEVPCEGELYYRGINVEDLTKGFLDEKRFGFEEATYLLLFGRLPNQEELKDFCRILATQRTLPTNFVQFPLVKDMNPHYQSTFPINR